MIMVFGIRRHLAASMLDIVDLNFGTPLAGGRRARTARPARGIPLYGIDPENHFFRNRRFSGNLPCPSRA
jgi:hypothetical protein